MFCCYGNTYMHFDWNATNWSREMSGRHDMKGQMNIPYTNAAMIWKYYAPFNFL